MFAGCENTILCLAMYFSFSLLLLLKTNRLSGDCKLKRSAGVWLRYIGTCRFWNFCIDCQTGAVS